MITPIRNIAVIIKQYGISRLGYRLYFDLMRRSGFLKMIFPNGNYEHINEINQSELSFKSILQENISNFFFTTGVSPLIEHEHLKYAIDEVENIKQGNFLYFSSKYGMLGYPDTEWLLNPFEKKRFYNNKHWTDLTDFNDNLGDIKYIWEQSRFGWVYPLVRVYASTREEKYAEIFWNLLESWLEKNPPNMGPNWQCGQEAAIRSFAVIFGLFTFLASAATTEERLGKALSLLNISAERIIKHINYARIQMGNHAVSEAGVLWTIGLLFPFLKNSEKYKEFGKYVLEDEVKKFNFADGSYIQHSMNYQRLMLHVYLWCFRLAQINSLKFSGFTYERIRRSYLFLYNMQDPDSGFTPNYGPNDGANIFSLSNCEYPDFRPVIQAFHYLYTGKRIYEDGPHDEIMFWLFGRESLNAKVDLIERKSRDFHTGGYYTFRRKNSWGMTRCHTYRSRPNQADMLHFDLWWKGTNILRDSGTYSYFDPMNNWNRFFLSTRAHNTVEVGNTDQMIKGDRFRWYSLLKSRFHFHETGDIYEVWQGEHDGYKRLSSKAIHRRAIVNFFEDYWVVIDDILGKGKEQTRLIWNFPDIPYRKLPNGITLDTDNGEANIIVKTFNHDPDIHILYGSESGERFGWRSLYYGEKKPTPVLVSESRSKLPIRYITCISLGQQIPEATYNKSSIRFNMHNIKEHVELKLGLLKKDDSCIDELFINDNSVWKR